MAITSYGYVTLIDWLKISMDESTHPTVYHAPFLVEFINIEADTSGVHWTMHGVSSRGENEHGYDSTCEFDVVKRGKATPPAR